jgi:GT2 family glycosyltransferase
MRIPVLIGELELTDPISDIKVPERSDSLNYQGVRLLVRMQRIPVGYATLMPAQLDGPSLAREVWRQVGTAVNARRSTHGLANLAGLPVAGLDVEAVLAESVGQRPFMSVVINTHDRPASAVATVRLLTALCYEPYEIVLVDNAPSSDRTRDAVRAEFGNDPRLKYVREMRQGSSFAKNRGVAESSGDIIAFTDDDVIVDRWWLDGIVRGFSQIDDVACVTGLIPTARLESVAQLYFHQRQAWGTSCERRIFDLTDHRDSSPLYPYSAGVFGAGANFAMTRAALAELGGFDEALGAGTRCGGGEDLDVFMRTILAGHRLVYEPSAIVSHIHRTDVADLARQMRLYGSGCTAALTAVLLHSRTARRQLPGKIIAGAPRVARVGERTKGSSTDLPSGLLAKELSGMLLGPPLYLRTKLGLRRTAGSHSQVATAE